MTYRITTTVGIALVHSLVTVALLFTSFRGEGFNRGIPASLVEEIRGAVLTVLMFPLVDPVGRFLPGLPTVAQYGLFVLNGVLWGVVLVWLAGWRRRRGASGLETGVQGHESSE